MSSDAAVSRWSLKMSVLRFAPPEISRVLMVLGSLRVAVVSKWCVLRREIVLGMPETAGPRLAGVRATASGSATCHCQWQCHGSLRHCQCRKFKLAATGSESLMSVAVPQ
jgi:hypothetical protein